MNLFIRFFFYQLKEGFLEGKILKSRNRLDVDVTWVGDERDSLPPPPLLRACTSGMQRAGSAYAIIGGVVSYPHR